MHADVAVRRARHLGQCDAAHLLLGQVVRAVYRPLCILDAFHLVIHAADRTGRGVDFVIVFFHRPIVRIDHEFHIVHRNAVIVIKLDRHRHCAALCNTRIFQGNALGFVLTDLAGCCRILLGGCRCCLLLCRSITGFNHCAGHCIDHIIVILSVCCEPHLVICHAIVLLQLSFGEGCIRTVHLRCSQCSCLC